MVFHLFSILELEFLYLCLFHFYLIIGNMWHCNKWCYFSVNMEAIMILLMNFLQFKKKRLKSNHAKFGFLNYSCLTKKLSHFAVSYPIFNQRFICVFLNSLHVHIRLKSQMSLKLPLFTWFFALRGLILFKQLQCFY